MKNLLKRFGIIALIAVIGFSFAACGNEEPGGDPDDTPKTTGKLTITGFPDEYNGKYVTAECALPTEDAEEYIILCAAADIKVSQEEIIGGKVSNNTVTLKVWKFVIEGESEEMPEVLSYSGNDEVQFKVSVFDTENIKLDEKDPLVVGYGSVDFADGVGSVEVEDFLPYVPSALHGTWVDGIPSHVASSIEFDETTMTYSDEQMGNVTYSDLTFTRVDLDAEFEAEFEAGLAGYIQQLKGLGLSDDDIDEMAGYALAGDDDALEDFLEEKNLIFIMELLQEGLAELEDLREFYEAYPIQYDIDGIVIAADGDFGEIYDIGETISEAHGSALRISINEDEDEIIYNNFAYVFDHF